MIKYGRQKNLTDRREVWRLSSNAPPPDRLWRTESAARPAGNTTLCGARAGYARPTTRHAVFPIWVLRPSRLSPFGAPFPCLPFVRGGGLPKARRKGRFFLRGTAPRKGAPFPCLPFVRGGGLPKARRKGRFFLRGMVLPPVRGERADRAAPRRPRKAALTQKKRPPRAVARGGRQNRLIPVPSDRKPFFHGARFFRAFLSCALRAEPSRKGAYLPRSSP